MSNNALSFRNLLNIAQRPSNLVIVFLGFKFRNTCGDLHEKKVRFLLFKRSVEESAYVAYVNGYGSGITRYDHGCWTSIENSTSLYWK